jgi:hypothetical protein
VPDSVILEIAKKIDFRTIGCHLPKNTNTRAPRLLPDGCYAIPLTQGYEAIIDAGDLDLVRTHRDKDTPKCQ